MFRSFITYDNIIQKWGYLYSRIRMREFRNIFVVKIIFIFVHRENSKISLLIRNTENNENDTWIRIRDGKVVDRGTGPCPQSDHIIDLNGQTVIPGLGDAHIHISDVGWGMEVLDLHSSRSSTQFINLLKNYFESAKTPFFLSAYSLLYHKFGNMLIFGLAKLYFICSPGNQHYQKITQF